MAVKIKKKACGECLRKIPFNAFSVYCIIFSFFVGIVPKYSLGKCRTFSTEVSGTYSYRFILKRLILFIFFWTSVTNLWFVFILFVLNLNGFYRYGFTVI
jgi:hypothetical protein